MNSLSQIDLGSTILSIALAAGFVAFAVLVFRLVTIGITKIFRALKVNAYMGEKESSGNKKGF